MGSSLDRLIAEHQGNTGGGGALDALIAKHGSTTPGVGQQAINAGEQVYNFLRHPIDAAKSVVKGVITSAKDAITPAIGERNTPGGPAVTGFDAQGNPTYGATIITKENTPDAITKEQKALGTVNTLANVVLPGVGGAATRVINAGLGAINDKEQPVRGALTGLAIGELLHAPHTLAHLGDVSEGMVPHDLGTDPAFQAQANTIRQPSPGRRPLWTLPENQQLPVEPPESVHPASAGVENTSALDKLISTQQYIKTRNARVGLETPEPQIVRRPLESVPMADRRPVEPAPDATVASFGGTDLTPEQVALRARLAQDAGIAPEAIGSIGRRAMNVQAPVEPPETAHTVSVGSRVGRRPGGEVVTPEALPTPEAGPYTSPSGKHFGPVPEITRITPDELVPQNDDEIAGAIRDMQRDGLTPEQWAKSVDLSEPVDAHIFRDGNIKLDDGHHRYLAAKTLDVPLNVKLGAVNTRNEILNAAITRINEKVSAVDRPTGTPGALDALIKEHAPKAVETLDKQGQQDTPSDSRMGPVSFGAVDESAVKPLVSSNGTFEARRGVLAKVNKDLGGPESTLPLPKYSAEGGKRALPDIGEPPAYTVHIAPEGEIPARNAAPLEAPESRPSDILNVAKLNLSDATAEQRIANQLEQFRSLRDSNKQTFAEADVNRAQIVKELTAGDPLALEPKAAKRLSGEELLARRDVVRQNDAMIADLSKAIESKTLSVADHQQAVELLDKAYKHNDALLSDLVTGSSQKGRDLNLLRRMANKSLDPDVWQMQAKRMLGDKPLTDEISTMIRKLSQEAIDACGSGA